MAFPARSYMRLIGNELRMSILPDEEKRIRRDERHGQCRKRRGITGERGSDGKRFFPEEIRYAEHEEQAGEDSDSQCRKERQGPSDFSKREKHEENPPPERARGEAGEKTGGQVFPTRHGAKLGARYGDGIFPFAVGFVTEVGGKPYETEASEPLDEKHVRPRIERFENVLGQKYENRDVGQVGDGEDEREGQARKEPATAVENGCREERLGVSGTGSMDEPEPDGQREKPPESRSRRVLDELGHALQDLSEKIRPVDR